MGQKIGVGEPNTECAGLTKYALPQSFFSVCMLADAD
uniref:Uncharacterized protein n=1 Tax=Utricularia reniformis TaxID=192314 RepID=A0A1Y0B1W0_9LAMI|nr:hypothetical protein AEK19_MT1163 [Utricularia reniformis]ART31377.1 hypothetical protein AEK19_MT1163 [Utricularia reniformis]